MSERVVIRIAHPDDEHGLRRLAQLDSKRLPPGRLLVAEVDGELWAAVSLEAVEGIADPFRRSGELLGLLHERARQLQRADATGRWRRRGRARAARAAATG
jgi:hypothetical protein